MIFVLRRPTSNRRLLRKKVYRAPHSRHRSTIYSRQNKKLSKPYQEEFKDSHSPNIKTKRRPKREVQGFKMSYKSSYYIDDLIIEEDDEESD